MYKVFIGWDSREDIAYQVARHSILRRTKNVDVVPLKLSELPMLNRPVKWHGNQMYCPISEAPQTTEFSISRFLVPHLSKTGWSVFADCDIIVQTDIKELFDLADDRYAVMVVKHDYEPQDELHMVDQIQVKIKRKNWASVMMFNNDHPANKNLTLEIINTWPGRDLHNFKWLKDEEIGELPVSWNYLVGVSSGGDLPLPEYAGGNTGGFKINLAHFTLGGPWIKGFGRVPEDKLWSDEYINYMSNRSVEEHKKLSNQVF